LASDCAVVKGGDSANGIYGFTYPVYKRLLEKGKKKYAFEVMELAKEITAENA